MATITEKPFFNSTTRQASTSQMLPCKKDKTTEASVFPVAPATSHPPYTPKRTPSPRRRMGPVKSPSLLPVADTLQNEDEDLFHGVTGLASAVLRDVSGWLTGQFTSPSPRANGPPHHPPKAKGNVAAAQQSVSSALRTELICSTPLGHCSYAESAESGSTSCSSCSLTEQEKHGHTPDQSEHSLYRATRNTKGSHEDLPNSEPRGETVSSTRATSRSQVDLPTALSVKDVPRITTLSPCKNSPTCSEVTQLGKECLAKKREKETEGLPSSDGFVNGRTPAARRQISRPGKGTSEASVYEASYPGLSRWESDSDPASNCRREWSSTAERPKEKTSLTILSTSMKHCKSSAEFPSLNENLRSSARKQTKQRAAGVSSQQLDSCVTVRTEATPQGRNIVRDAGVSAAGSYTGAADATGFLHKPVDDPFVPPAPHKKHIKESAAPAASSFLSSFTMSFREHFEAATRSHEKAQKDTTASCEISGPCTSGDKTKSPASVRAVQKTEGETQQRSEFEISGDWSFKPEALFASFMSIFDVEDELESRGRADADALSAASFATSGTVECQTGVDRSKCRAQSRSDATFRTADIEKQGQWPADMRTNGGRGWSRLRCTATSAGKLIPVNTNCFENISLSSTSCPGASPTCTSASSILKTASTSVDFPATHARSAGSVCPALSTDAAAAVPQPMRRGAAGAPVAAPAPLGLRRNGTVTTDTPLSEAAEDWLVGDELSLSELEEPADGITHPQRWMDDAAAYTLRCVTRSHIEISVLHLHNIGKIVDASLTSGKAQLRCPGFNMLHLRVPFFEPETQIITLQFTTRISRSHAALLHTLARFHRCRISPQHQQVPKHQQLPRQQQSPQQQQQCCRDLVASMEDPRWRRLLRQLRWHRRVDEDRKKDAEVKRYRVDIPVNALRKKGVEKLTPERVVIIEKLVAFAAAKYLEEVHYWKKRQTEEEAKSSIYSPRLYLTMHKRLSGLLEVPPVLPETATTYKRPDSVKFAGKRIYVGWYDDPIDGAVAETLNSHPEVLALNKNIRRLEKGRYEVDGYECRIFLAGDRKVDASQLSASATADDDNLHEKHCKRREEIKARDSTKTENVKGTVCSDENKRKSQQRTPGIRGEEDDEEKKGEQEGTGNERWDSEHNGKVNKQRDAEGATDAEIDEEEDDEYDNVIPIVQEGNTMQPLVDYLKGTLENIAWGPPFPSSCIELIPSEYLPPLHGTLVPWEARVERRKAMELACHRAAIREQVAAELLRLQRVLTLFMRILRSCHYYGLATIPSLESPGHGVYAQMQRAHSVVSTCPKATTASVAIYQAHPPCACAACTGGSSSPDDVHMERTICRCPACYTHEWPSRTCASSFCSVTAASIKAG